MAGPSGEGRRAGAALAGRAGAAAGLALALAAVVAAASLLALRVPAEWAARTVEVVADLQAFETVARAEGRPLDDVLAVLGSAGVSGLGVGEVTPRRLVWSGETSLFPGAALRALAAQAGGLDPALAGLAAGPGFSRAHTYLLFDRRALAELAAAELCRQFSPCTLQALDGRWVLRVGAAVGRVADTGLGFWPPDLALARARGLRVVIRPRDRGQGAAELRDGLVRVLAGTVPGPVLFAGATIPAPGGDLGATAEVLRSLDLTLGAVARPDGRGHVAQAGLAGLVRLAEGRVVRVASAPLELLESVTPAALGDWWVAAARQHNARVIYVRPPEGPDPLGATVAALERLAHRQAAAGWPWGPARPLPAARPEPWQRLALAGGGLAIGLWLGRRRPLLSGHLGAAGLGLGLLAYAALDVALDGRRLLDWVALAGAVLVPVAAASALCQRWRRRLNRPEEAGAGGPPAVVTGLADVALFTAVWLGGALWLAAVTSDVALWLGSRTVPGTGPAGAVVRWSVTVAAVLALAAPAPGAGTTRLGSLAAASLRPLTLGAAVGALVAAGALGLGWWASERGAETLVPAVEALAGAPPRPVEALLAYPAIMLASWAARHRPAWLPWLAATAVLGPASVMADLLAGTVAVWWLLWRSWTGVVTGVALGAVAVLVAGNLTRNRGG